MYGPPLYRDGLYCYGEMDALMSVTELGSLEHNKLVGKDIGWKKRSIFWDLPYWKDLLIRHHLDIMHIEKNCFENIFYTILGVCQGSQRTIHEGEWIWNTFVIDRV
ncbi:unnamed protein product [Cuscuta europaea]|uniref:Uncharacterized protein n=1 Tax=Cuscuta europaea TaxID=41803 RepID=A0A9P1EKV0_CUSEU|nr:unnamed protein product [Cuscuta europaea]